MAIGWKLFDLPRISPSIFMHRILLEEEAQPFFCVYSKSRDPIGPPLLPFSSQRWPLRINSDGLEGT
ncbi:hypothetical protein CR513_17423, partial [Mucuna pruriens]